MSMKNTTLDDLFLLESELFESDDVEAEDVEDTDSDELEESFFGLDLNLDLMLESDDADDDDDKEDDDDDEEESEKLQEATFAAALLLDTASREDISQIAESYEDMGIMVECFGPVMEKVIVRLDRKARLNHLQKAAVFKLAAQAKDTKLLLNDLINITRDIVVYKNLNNTNYTNYNVKIIEDVVKDVPFDYFYKIIEYLSQTEQYIRFSTEYMSYMQICIVKICSIANYSNTKIDVVSNDGSNIVVNTQIQELESRIILLEKKLLQIKNQKVDLNNKIDNSSTTKDSYLSNNVEIKEVIIKDKSKIVELINSSNDNFTNYASNVFGRIINNSFSTDNNEMYAMGEIFKSCKLVASSKIAGLLVFNEAESMIKMAPNSKYKKYLEELFRRYIGVDYAIYTLQDNQYNTLLDEIKKISPKKDSLVEIKEEQEEKEDSKNNSKIEQLFSDIIVEK